MGFVRALWKAGGMRRGALKEGRARGGARRGATSRRGRWQAQRRLKGAGGGTARQNGCTRRRAGPRRGGR